MDRGDHRGQDIENRIDEDWMEPFRRALELHGRPGGKHKWYIIWARKLAGRVKGRSLRQVTRKDVEDFLATLSTSPGIAPLADGLSGRFLEGYNWKNIG